VNCDQNDDIVDIVMIELSPVIILYISAYIRFI